jgi:predicted nucleotidyltransferase
MIALIEDNTEAIAGLCERFGVRRLALFGSAAKEAYDPARSDIDLLVDLGDYDDRVGKRFMGFAAAIEGVPGQTVDVTTMPIKDAAFRSEVERTEEVLYESDRQQTAA